MKGRLLGISILLIFVLSLCAYAQVECSHYGCGGVSYSTFQRPIGLFNSQLYSGTLPVGNNSQSIYNYRMPIVANFQTPNNLLASNQVILFDNRTMYIYDGSFNQEGSYLLAGWNGGSIDSVSDGSTTYVAYMSIDGADYTIKILNISGGIANARTINISDNTYTGGVYGGIAPYLYYPDVTYNITRLNIINGTETRYYNPVQNTSTCSDGRYPFLTNDVDVNDVNRDGVDEIGFINLLGSRAISYVLYTGSNTFVKIDNTSSNYPQCDIHSAQIGSSSSSYYYLINNFAGTTTTYKVFDISGNNKLTNTFSGGVSMGEPYVFPTVGDIDADGMNEYLIIDKSTGIDNFKIYDSSFSLMATFNGLSPYGQGFSSGVNGNFYSIGKYVVNNTRYNDIVSLSGIYSVTAINTTSKKANFTKVYNLPSGKALGVIPTPINQRQTKDILFIGSDGVLSWALFSTFGGVQCGDGVCGAGETALTCPADCAPTQPSDAILTSVSINPCNTVPIKMNETIQFKIKAETQDNSLISNVSVDYCANCGGGCAQYYSFGNVQSGSVTTIDVNANCTGSGLLTNVLAKTATQIQPNQLQYYFTINPDTGQEFGDSTCGTTQPLSAIPVSLNTTTDLDDNFLTQGMKDFSAYTKLGLNILTFFILIFVSGGIFYIGSKNQYPANTVMGLIILVDAFIVLIATNLGWINVGIVITLAIVGLIVIGLWISNLFKQTA